MHSLYACTVLHCIVYDTLISTEPVIKRQVHNICNASLYGGRGRVSRKFYVLNVYRCELYSCNSITSMMGQHLCVIENQPLVN